MKIEIKKWHKEFIEELKNNLNDLKSTKTFYKQIPNILTFVRALAPIPFNIFYFNKMYKWAIIILAIAFFTDAIDGKIARKYNLVSKFGAHLDAMCDKLIVIGVIIPVCFQNYGLLLNLILELVIAFTNVFASLKGIKPKSSMIGKLKTWPLFITILVAYLSITIYVPSSMLICFITITVILQVFTTLDYISKNVISYNQLTIKK